MIGEDTIKELNEWVEDEDRNPDTVCIDGQYSICSTDIDDFCECMWRGNMVLEKRFNKCKALLKGENE